VDVEEDRANGVVLAERGTGGSRYCRGRPAWATCPCTRRPIQVEHTHHRREVGVKWEIHVSAFCRCWRRMCPTLEWLLAWEKGSYELVKVISLSNPWPFVNVNHTCQFNTRVHCWNWCALLYKKCWLSSWNYDIAVNAYHASMNYRY
jgi:hypothetical protein